MSGAAGGSPFRVVAAGPVCAAQTLALEHLRGAHVTVGAEIDAGRWRRAIATLHGGPDPTVGETSVALFAGDFSPGPGCHGALLTDRRIVARSDATFVDARYEDLVGVQSVAGIVFDDLVLQFRGHALKVSGLQGVAPLRAFLEAMCGLHPTARIPPTRQLPARSREDPTGVRDAWASLWASDPRSRAILGVVEAAFAQGQLAPEAASDLVARAVIFDRMVAYGQGSAGGWWLSPLTADDLAVAFARLLGPPVTAWSTGQGRGFRHRITARGSPIGAAVSSGVGLAALALFGVGWVAGTGGEALVVDVHIARGPLATGFALFEDDRPLARHAPGMLESVFEQLEGFTARALLQRAAWGGAFELAPLDRAGAEALSRRVTALAGPVDLGAFFVRG